MDWFTAGWAVYVETMWKFSKGQLISKCPFGVFKSSQKTNEIVVSISATVNP